MLCFDTDRPWGPRTANRTMCNKADSIYDAVLSQPQESVTTTRREVPVQRKINLDPYGGDGVYVDVQVESSLDSGEDLLVGFDFEAFLGEYAQAPSSMSDKYDISRTIERLAMVGGHIGEGRMGVASISSTVTTPASSETQQPLSTPQQAKSEKEHSTDGEAEHLPCWP